jgi:transaldolase
MRNNLFFNVENNMNSIKILHNLGQSIWLDYISRSLLTGGELKNLLDEGVTGVTSNPSIFQKSFTETKDYDKAIKSILKSRPDISTAELYEKLAVEDIQAAADCLREVFDTTQGADGFVSFEVSPHLADRTEETVKEARRLWNLVDRPNLMIKVPATPEGIPAIETLIAGGINVNATLIFSRAQYERVALAYIRGLEKSLNPEKVASVASFFVSRIDSAVDKELEKAGTTEALDLRGKSAIASAKTVYQSLNNIFYGKTFEKQKKRGGKVQKMVWGSTGTKNPAYSDVIYVEEIIGPDTINTIPMTTLKAFLDHGKPRLSLKENISQAAVDLAKLGQFKIDFNSLTDQLLKEGVLAFVNAYDQLLESLEGHRKKQ